MLLQLLQDGRADQPLLCLAHVVLGLRLDQGLLMHDHGLTMSDLCGDVPDQAIGDVLEDHRLERERSRPGRVRALNQRAAAQRLDGLHH